MKKLIGISQRLIENTTYAEEREALALDWGMFFKQYLKEFLPLPLSYALEASSYIPYLSGVLLSGGNDLAELHWNPISLKRDKYEQELIKLAMRFGIPLLGVCRGAQRIAYDFNASLQKVEGHIGVHKIHTKDGEFLVNSFHHYGISKLGEELEGLAWCEDSTCEAFKHREFPIYGVLWHIEREKGMLEESVFKEWLELVRGR